MLTVTMLHGLSPKIPRVCPDAAAFRARKSSSTVGFFPRAALDPEAKIPTGFDVVFVDLRVALGPVLCPREVEEDAVDEGRGIGDLDGSERGAAGLSGSDEFIGRVEACGASSFCIWRNFASMAAILSSVLRYRSEYVREKEHKHRST